MATVATIMARTPAWVQARYSATYFLKWLNELLEECSAEPKLFRDLRIETGVTVDDKQWIDKPSGLREVIQIYNPAAEDQKYNFRYTNNRIKLEGATVDDYTAAATVNTFSHYATTYIDVNLASATEDQYAGYLFRITAGTYAGRSYIIDRNDASSGGECRLYFKHPLTTALVAANVTAAELISYDYYVIMEYTSSYSELTSSSDEVPLDDLYERRITSAWLNWKVFDEVDPSLSQAGKAMSDYGLIMKKIKRELRSSTGGRLMPRYSPGWDQFKGDTEPEKTFAEEI